jgi:hypothetical protein
LGTVFDLTLKPRPGSLGESSIRERLDLPL